MARHLRDALDVLPRLMSIGEGRSMIVLPQKEPKHSIKAGRKRGVYWRPPQGKP